MHIHLFVMTIMVSMALAGCAWCAIETLWEDDVVYTNEGRDESYFCQTKPKTTSLMFGF